MAKEPRSFTINGPIDQYYYGCSYVDYMLRELGADPLTLYVSSLGGDLNEALKIKKAISDHGEVTVEYFGFNASSATVLGHGAKKTIINEDSLYMIHKPMMNVQLYGLMNEDELAEAIKNLEHKKADAETVTRVIVQDYVNCRGIDIDKVYGLIKEGKWLSAKEALDLGLVDEVKPGKSARKAAKVTNQSTIAMMTANGLPIPDMTSLVEGSDEKGASFFGSIFNHNKKITMNKDLTFINQALNVEGLEVKDGSVSMTVEQLLALNTKIHTAENSLTTLTSEKDAAVQAKGTADTALSGVLSNLDTLDPSVMAAADAEAKFMAIKTILANRPGITPSTPQGDGSQNKADMKDGADWDAIDALPHNQAVDHGII